MGSVVGGVAGFALGLGLTIVLFSGSAGGGAGAAVVTLGVPTYAAARRIHIAATWGSEPDGQGPGAVAETLGGGWVMRVGWGSGTWEAWREPSAATSARSPSSARWRSSAYERAAPRTRHRHRAPGLLHTRVDWFGLA